MNKENTTENNKKSIEKIEAFFKEQIPLKDFAQQIRRSNYILAELMMKPDAEQNVSKSYWIEDCFFHLNQFAELIDPNLEAE